MRKLETAEEFINRLGFCDATEALRAIRARDRAVALKVLDRLCKLVSPLYPQSKHDVWHAIKILRAEYEAK